MTKAQIDTLRSELSSDPHGLAVFEIPDKRKHHKGEVAVFIYNPKTVTLNDLTSLAKSWKATKSQCDCLPCSGGKVWIQKLGHLLDYPCRFITTSKTVYRVNVNGHYPLLWFSCQDRKQFQELKKKYGVWKTTLKAHDIHLGVVLCERLV